MNQYADIISQKERIHKCSIENQINTLNWTDVF